MAPPTQKDVTNEELARMIAEGFAGVDEKLDNVDEKLDNTATKEDVKLIDERLIIVERKLDKALYREFERIDKLEKRMKVVEVKLGIS